MQNKTRSDFTNHDEWLSYVRENVRIAEQPYVLACGRTELFKRLYAVRKEALPSEFNAELERIHALGEPERSAALDALNQRILESLGSVLRAEAQPEATTAANVNDERPANDVQELLDHLTGNNPYFALWVAYKGRTPGQFDGQGWEQYVCGAMGPGGTDDVAFARAMADLDKLLEYFLGSKLPLPEYFFDRCWFLHYLREPERMVHTRVLLNTLAAEIKPCASA